MACGLFAGPCPGCGRETEARWNYCPVCGSSLGEPERVDEAAAEARAKRREMTNAIWQLRSACADAGQAEEAARVDLLLQTFHDVDFWHCIPEPPWSFGLSGGCGRYGGRLGGRRNLVARGGGSQGPGGTEAAVTQGLRWLARHQGPAGNWSCAAFEEQCPGAKCAGEGNKEYDAGCTGLALLAFLGSGYSRLTKETYVDPCTGNTVCWGDVIRNGINWLRIHQTEEGCFGEPRGPKSMVNHALAALAMAEAYGMTDTMAYKDSAQKGIDYILAAQNPDRAWRYTPRCGDNDTSVTSWCVLALKIADNDGLNVRRSAFLGARRWLDDVTDEKDFKAGYMAKGTGKNFVEGRNEDWAGHESMTAAGMFSRILIERSRQHPSIEGGAALLLADLPDAASKKVDYYYWYLGTLALFQYDGPAGKCWTKWNGAMKDALLPLQREKKDGCASGSWDPDIDRWGFDGGRVYATALNVLTLETYYRYPVVNELVR
jgi:hypothetical protein